MKQHSSLDELPLELLEATVGHLHLHDACNLRLTNSSMAAKVARAKTFSLDKTINIDGSRDLRRLVEMTKYGRIGNALKCLSITGKVTSNHQATVRRTTIAETTIALLGQAFSNLHRHSFHGGLGSLCLTVDAPVRTRGMAPNFGVPNWKDVWLMAASIFRTGMQALHTSQLPLRRLNVFGDAKRCSLAMNQLAAASRLNLRCSFERLEDLSLNLSNNVSDTDGDDESYGLEQSEETLRGLCRFLQLSPSIRRLKLRWFTNQAGRVPAPLLEERVFFKRLLHSIDFASVRDCTLIGVRLQASELVSFLQKLKLESLSLQSINLEPGDFEHVFKQICCHKKLKYLRLQDLAEREMVCFDVPGEPAFESSEPNGPSLLVRKDEEIYEPIVHHLRRGVILGSARFNNWLTQKDLTLGPPDF